MIKRNNKRFQEIVDDPLLMYRLTKDDIVNTYWQNISESIQNGFFSYIIRGGLQWQQKEKIKLSSKDDKIWLQSNFQDFIGKPIDHNPVKLYLQLYMNLYEIWGGIKFKTNFKDENEAKIEIENCISDVSLLSDIISLMTASSITWYPARYSMIRNIADPSIKKEQLPEHEKICYPLPKSQEEHTSAILENDHINKYIIPLFDFIRNINNLEISTLLRRAISWHSQGNYLGSGLNRFLNYWESIELVSYFFYNKLPNSKIGKLNRSERKKKVKNLLSQKITDKNCLQIANECSQLIQPSVKKIMCNTLGLITNRNDIEKLLFSEHKNTGKSIYDIRNDIAHGNYCNNDFEFRNIVQKSLYDISKFSRIILIDVINNIDRVEKLLDC
ncbi:MAG: hypothetical protein GF353_28340 [Candidatus Lokiarchaeota archaeon]|nr:hypothetical protein [Candidatus Lokiarchaeota archaeon]